MKKWIIWSFDAQEDQTFADIVVARDLEAARRKVARKRPYATLDRYCVGEALEAYITALQKAADRTVREIENDWKEL
jgi:hypothetical protein